MLLADRGGEHAAEARRRQEGSGPEGHRSTPAKDPHKTPTQRKAQGNEAKSAVLTLKPRSRQNPRNYALQKRAVLVTPMVQR